MKKELAGMSGLVFGISGIFCLGCAYGDAQYPPFGLCVFMYVAFACLIGILANWIVCINDNRDVQKGVTYGGAAVSVLFATVVECLSISARYYAIQGGSTGEEIVEVVLGSSQFYAALLVALLTYATTFIFLLKRPVYISHVTEESRVSGTADTYALQLEPIKEDSELICNMRMIRAYEYKLGDISTWMKEDISQRFLADFSKEIYHVIYYNGKPYGYFLSEVGEDERNHKCITIRELYVAVSKNEAPAVLYSALKQYFSKWKDMRIRIEGMENLPQKLAESVEIGVRDYTNFNYSLDGDKDESGKLHYSLKFRNFHSA